MLLLGVSTPRTSDPARLAQRSIADRLAVLTTDHDWRVSDVSSDVEALFGSVDQQMVGLPILGMVHPLDATNVVPALARLESEREAVTVTLRARLEGDWRDCLLTVAALCGHTPPRLVCLFAPADGSAVRDPLTADADPVDQLLHEVTDGEILPEVARAVLRRATRVHSLTGRQWEIVARLIRGQSTGDIARSMFLSPGTVRNQLTAIYRQFGVRSQTALLSSIYAGDAAPKSCA
jgi:DNA-binding CsgD family transcriptional regulator